VNTWCHEMRNVCNRRVGADHALGVNTRLHVPLVVERGIFRRTAWHEACGGAVLRARDRCERLQAHSKVAISDSKGEW